MAGIEVEAVRCVRPRIGQPLRVIGQPFPMLRLAIPGYAGKSAPRPQPQPELMDDAKSIAFATTSR
jgi:hypothetical protein